MFKVLYPQEAVLKGKTLFVERPEGWNSMQRKLHIEKSKI
jgi:hypothetical protein